MKSKMKFVIVIIIAILVMAGVVMFVNIGGAEISEGKYKIVGYEEYPDAYILVEENTIQFFNIDLNAIYQQGEIDEYKRMLEKGLPSDFTDEQVKEYTDYNKLFADNPYTMNYEEGGKDGTFLYIYHCLVGDNIFGFVLWYNSFDKTIEIKNPIQNLLFER